MLGAMSLARANRARTSFSDSPKYLLVRLLAEMEKKVDWDSVATARASIVLPVPGGPNSSMPRAGSRRPMNRSGRRNGYTTVSRSAFFATSSPATSLQRTSSPCTTISLKIAFAAAESTPGGKFLRTAFFLLSHSLLCALPSSSVDSAGD